MQGSNQFKQALLESLLLELQKPGVVASRKMGFHGTKHAIRLAADAALVNVRGAGATRWSRTMQTAVELGNRQHVTPRAKSASGKTILRRGHRLRRPRMAVRAMACGSTGVLARAFVRKRRTVLKRIVPGVEKLDDECTLLSETLDYAVCLRAQVDVMQLLVRALQAAKP
ncbi:transcription factor IBH1-like 1 [Lolium rigidum]|uniref:transcription factor IBH1-like 1 n=1 Tax=Lolium rigidum TaxID=89674 RepID=UPI001F5D54DC|nr:transcription factor IBH1-like 1 [Lolium rigidum]